MAIWTATGLVLFGVRRLLIAACGSDGAQSADGVVPELSVQRQRIVDWLAPLAVILPVLFLSISAVSLLSLGWPQRSAGLLALCGLLATEPGRLRMSVVGAFGPLLNWQLLVAVIAGWTGMTGSVSQLTVIQMSICGLPLAAFAVISAWAFENRRLRSCVSNVELLAVHQVLLLTVAVGLLCGAVHWNDGEIWTAIDIVWAGVAWAAITGIAFTNAIRTQDPDRVWMAEWTLAGTVVYFTIIDVLNWSAPDMMYAVTLIGLLHWAIGRWSAKSNLLKILSEPLQQIGFWFPLAVVPLALFREFQFRHVEWAGSNSLPLLVAAAFYFWRGMERRQVGVTTLSAVILNLACALLWKDLGWADPQLFMVPIGISVLVLTELLRQEIPSQYHDRLRLTGSLMILVSPVFHIVTGSWTHILTLMLASAALALVSIGLRIRTLLYTSTAFLLADLVALVARSSVDEPNILWVVGVVLGTSIIALGAACENHRETILARLRCLAVELEQWT